MTPFINGRFTRIQNGLNNLQSQDIKKVFEQEQSDCALGKP
jgi:hypothetical protein